MAENGNAMKKLLLDEAMIAVIESRETKGTIDAKSMFKRWQDHKEQDGSLYVALNPNGTVKEAITFRSFSKKEDVLHYFHKDNSIQIGRGGFTIGKSFLPSTVLEGYRSKIPNLKATSVIDHPYLKGANVGEIEEGQEIISFIINRKKPEYILGPEGISKIIRKN